MIKPVMIYLLGLVLPISIADIITIPLVPHHVVKQRKLQAGEALPKLERPQYSKYDRRFEQTSAEQVAGLYQGYGTVRLLSIVTFFAHDGIASTMPICGAEVPHHNDKRLLLIRAVA